MSTYNRMLISLTLQLTGIGILVYYLGLMPVVGIILYSLGYKLQTD